MKLFIKKLSLTNFKGIKSKEIQFADITTISGANQSGKSTILDAFIWLLFGRDQADRANFSIKTIDKNGQVIPRIEHRVVGEFLTDGSKITLSRNYQEKWEKPRGQAEHVFSGHETVYMVNDVVVTQKDYEATVNSMIRQDLFKLLTVPSYFNSMKWEERRRILTSIVSIPSDAEIAGNEFTEVLKQINEQYKTVTNLKKAYSLKKKGLEKTLAEIPGRIDEAHKAMPEAKDFEAIQKEIDYLVKQIGVIDAQIADSSKAIQKEVDAKSEVLRRKSALESEMSAITIKVRHEFANQADDKSRTLKQLQDDCGYQQRQITLIEQDIAKFESYKQQAEKDREQLLSEFNAIRATQFIMADQTIPHCPTCGQVMPEQQLEAAFTANKKIKLEAINQKGKQKRETLDAAIANLTRANADLETAKAKLQGLQRQYAEAEKTPSLLKSVEAMLAENKQYNAFKKELEALVVPEISTTVDNSDLLSQKYELNLQMDRLKADLNAKTIIRAQEIRIEQLKEEERTTSQELASLEGIEYQAEMFQRKKMQAVEDAVNKLFPTVKWRLFDRQVNGGEAEDCTCLINGVPYPDANSADKINAGIEILNVFSQIHEITAPVFVDNAESVNHITIPNGQLIAFYVTMEKGLQVKAEEKERQVA